MLDVSNVSVNYGEVQALERVSFRLPEGSLVGLIGPNGAGKSTLIRSLLSLIPLEGGQVLYQGQPLRRQRRRVAYVPQRSQIDWDYPITVWNVVMMGRTAHLGWFHSPGPATRDLVQAALQRVEMEHLRHRQIGELSGGEQQRVFLARALAQQADVFLLDEPLAGVDKRTEALLFEVYAELKAQHKILLISCHEWGAGLNRYDRLLLLNRWLIAEGFPEQVMTPENIQRAYGVPTLDRYKHDAADAMLFC
ncbi:manganese ABC transporter ATP-binding protein [Leptolyngbya sp. 'hensonii']|uniref:metal ABC transporter ATP-binding protein n=1 Tax=Leptolyngbya sp. 'hensonii' TaxID=1922337 RepID=UPI00094FD193|nr:metal ABC transporter ATP-binding protein [Leptolyngbya sp. 'hensonii']OLP16578.1 manganese ABC transporter ATP-binding protein [Leptolyngbya sp. 'hensonii']